MLEMATESAAAGCVTHGSISHLVEDGGGHHPGALRPEQHDLLGHVEDRGPLPGDVVDELGELPVVEVLGALDLEGAAGVLLVLRR